jgi:hypothetical protein
MNNKTLLYLGIAAVAYYIYTKSNKKITHTKESIMALSDADLNALLIDLGNAASKSKYADSAAYSYMVVTEIQRRKNTGGKIITVKDTVGTGADKGPVLSF